MVVQKKLFRKNNLEKNEKTEMESKEILNTMQQKGESSRREVLCFIWTEIAG